MGLLSHKVAKNWKRFKKNCSYFYKPIRWLNTGFRTISVFIWQYDALKLYNSFVVRT